MRSDREMLEDIAMDCATEGNAESFEAIHRYIEMCEDALAVKAELMDLWRINGVMQENKPEIFNEKTIKRLLIEREEMLEVLYRIKDSNVFLGAIAKEMMDQVLEKAETLSTSLEQRGEK